jgi:fermentation-respiration switch protein FrsA (DUF1100 family)
MAQVPPLLGVHGALDNLVPVDDARRFYRRLRARRHAAPPTPAPAPTTTTRTGTRVVPDVYVELASAHHCFNWLPSPRTLAFDAATVAFLTRVHGGGR